MPSLKLFIYFSVLWTCVHSLCSEESNPKITFHGHAFETNDKTLGLIPYGHDLEITCSSRNTRNAKLRMTVLRFGRQPDEIVNDTTIRYLGKDPEKQIGTIMCYDFETNCNILKSYVVGSPPKPKNFHCISKNLEILNCSWTSEEEYVLHNISLHFLVNGYPVGGCQFKGLMSHSYQLCSWYIYGSLRYRQHFETYIAEMKMENLFGSTVETFIVHHFLIVKPDPPSIRIQNVTSHSVVLEWSVPNNIADLLPGGVDRKITYHIPGAETKTIKPKFITTARTRKSYLDVINLPCAGKSYSVRISIRPKLASGEEFWSDPATIQFSTPTMSGLEDPNCWKPIETPEIMLWQVWHLKNTAMEGNNKLKNVIESLRIRATAIDSY